MLGGGDRADELHQAEGKLIATFIWAKDGWTGVFYGAWPAAAMAARCGGVPARLGPSGWA